MHTDLPSLPQLEAAMAAPGADHAAIAKQIRAVVQEIDLLRCDAQVALGHDDAFRDQRPALVAFIAGIARLHGRSSATQLQLFILDRDPLFLELAIRAWGLGFDA